LGRSIDNAANRQIQIGKQPVTQITIIDAEPEKQAEALAIMTERARFMARQPGSWLYASARVAFASCASARVARRAAGVAYCAPPRPASHVAQP